MVWLKFIHITAISIWSAALICLPGLYVQRAHVASRDSLHRLQRMVRFMYVGAMSPAAFLGIATGTGLIFLRETWAPWFGLKLLFVGVLATLHIVTGLVIIRLFDDGQIYPVWRFIVVTVLTIATVSIILFLVLAKPQLPPLLPEWMHEPGALGRIMEKFNPFRSS